MAGGLPWVSGNTTGPVLVNGTQGTGAGSSGPPAGALVDTAGDMFVSNVSFKPIDETYPMNQVFGSTGTAKMLPTLAGNILNSKTTATSTVMLYCDTYLGVTSTAAARTISLPSNPVPNAHYMVKDESMGATTNNITVNVDGATGTIDGLASAVISINGGSFTFKADNAGVNYFII
jgi:hypothetical protein